jgi:hypothetical protein
MSVEIDIIEFHKDLDGDLAEIEERVKRRGDRRCLRSMKRRSGASKQRKTKKECKAQWLV